MCPNFCTRFVCLQSRPPLWLFYQYRYICTLPAKCGVNESTTHVNLHRECMVWESQVTNQTSLDLWGGSRSGIHMFSLRALPIKSILEQRSIATHIGSRSITRQAGGILPGSFSCTLRQRVQLREMPLLCDYSRGSVFVLNRLWMTFFNQLPLAPKKKRG